jgi:hypothetical protein
MKEFTKEMLQTLIEADKKVRGTVEYTKFLMQYDYKEKGRWHFCTHTLPHKTGIIKTFKGKTYIITEGWQTEGNRYHVTDEVKALLNI